jgi:prepilin peptidase CpaA
MFWTTLVMFVCLSVAAWNDVRSGLIYNWTTYPGILLGLAAQYADARWIGVADGLRGFLVCGGLILFIFLFGGTGGGDVKLIAMLGAGLGLRDGIESMLWTFVIAALMAVCVLIWQVGALRLLRQTMTQALWMVRLRGWVPLTTDERRPLQRTLFLAPAAWLALLLVRSAEIREWFDPLEAATGG